MKVLLRRPVASQSSGSDGLTAEDDEGGSGGQHPGEREWGVSVEVGVWDEPIIKRWEDAKVGLLFWCNVGTRREL